MRISYIFLVCSFTLNLLSSPASLAAGTRFKKVMIVILENENFSDAAQQPFLASLASHGALLKNFFAESHPSQPNYVALISGSTHGVSNDSNVNIDANHLGDLLEAKNLDWKVYAEQYPGNCFLGKRSGDYVRKHVPFISFKNVQDNPKRCGKITGAETLARDIEAGTLSDFSLYIPDLKNDGHDTNIDYADRWLSKTFGPILQNPKFTKDMLFVVTFDEGSLFGNNRIMTVLSGDSVLAGAISETKLNHYSLLRLIEDEYGLGTLKLEDEKATQISGVWKN